MVLHALFTAVLIAWSWCGPHEPILAGEGSTVFCKFQFERSLKVHVAVREETFGRLKGVQLASSYIIAESSLSFQPVLLFVHSEKVRYIKGHGPKNVCQLENFQYNTDFEK